MQFFLYRQPSAARSGRVGVLLLPALLVASIGCSGKAGESPKPAATGSPPAVATPQQKQPVDATTAGGVSGTVQYTGAVPPSEPVDMRSEAWCGRQHPGGASQAKVAVHDGKLAGAFVWIAAGLERYSFPQNLEPVVLDQEGCLFTPRVLGVRVGQPVRLLNSDQILHNVHAKPAAGRDRNLALPNKGSSRDVAFERAETMVPVVCDVHPWMKAWIGVVDHPFFAVTGQDGAFNFAGLPPGQYTLRAWHEVLGTRDQTITVAPQQQAQVPPMVFAAP